MPRAGRYGVESSESFFDDGLDDDADDDESLVVVFFSPPSPRPRRLFQAQGRGGALLLDQHCRSSSAAATGKDGKLKSRSFFFSSSSQKPSHPSRPPGHLFFFFFKNEKKRQPPPPPPRVPVEPVRPLPFPKINSGGKEAGAAGEEITVLRGECTKRLKVEVEYGLRRGTTDNCYLIRKTSSSSSPSSSFTLVDVPDESWADTSVAALLEATGGSFPDELVVTHLTPKRLPSLRALLSARRDAAKSSSSPAASVPPPPLCIFLSNPALRLFRESIGPAPGDAELLQGVTLRAARAGAGGGSKDNGGSSSSPSSSAATTASAAGGGRLRLLPAPTPRWPDLLLVFDTSTRVLFTGKLFSAHVSPKVAAAGGGSGSGASSPSDAFAGADSGDSGGFDSYGKDWKHFYECMLSPVNAQATALLDRLDLRAAATGGGGGNGRNASSTLDEVTSNSGLASALRALEDALSDLQRSAFGAGAMGGGGSSSEAGGAAGGLAVAAVAPMHGPVVASSLPQLLQSYRAWASEAARAASRASVAVFYASAYGNTAALAQAIARGATKAGVGAEAVNLEDAPLSEVESALRRCSGFAIGSPTLGGHMPTQVTTALGAILRAPAAAREGKPAGAFGSFGWSGEAVDELERKLRDGGYRTAFPAVRVKFRPTAADMQAAEESGTDLAQEVLRRKAAREREAKRAAAATAAGASSSAASSAAAVASSDLSSSSSTSSSNVVSSSPSSSSAELAAELAVGRVVGTLCVVTAGRVPPEEDGGGAGAEEAGGAGGGEGSAAAASAASAAPSSSAASSAMLASWISQASFDPPGLTVAVKKDRAAEPFLVPGARFAVNVLAEGPGARLVSKAMLRPFAPGEDRLAGWGDAASGAREGEESGAAILPSRLLASWLECEAVDRMEAGDHWVVYASVLAGGLGGEEEEEEEGKKKKKGASAGANDVLSAVHHRKSGGTY